MTVCGAARGRMRGRPVRGVRTHAGTVHGLTSSRTGGTLARAHGTLTGIRRSTAGFSRAAPGWAVATRLRWLCRRACRRDPPRRDGSGGTQSAVRRREGISSLVQNRDGRNGGGLFNALADREGPRVERGRVRRAASYRGVEVMRESASTWRAYAALLTDASRRGAAAGHMGCGEQLNVVRTRREDWSLTDPHGKASTGSGPSGTRYTPGCTTLAEAATR